LENHKRILVIRLSSIGDVILTTAVLKAFKEKYPNMPENITNAGPRYND